MDIIKNIYGKLESSLSVTLRVSMVIAVTIVLLIALYNAVVGYINSGAEAKLETSVSGLDYRDAEELLFAKQEQVEVEEEDEEAEEEEVVVDPKFYRFTKAYLCILMIEKGIQSNSKMKIKAYQQKL